MPSSQKVNTSYLSDLVTSYRSKLNDDRQMVDIITFIEAPWGLNIEMLPMQRFLLKVFYGLPLDKGNKYIPIYDDTRSKLLGMLDETGVMDFMISEKRTNLTSYEPGKTRKELVIVGGRRGSKSTITSFICNYELYRLCSLGDPQAYYGFRRGQEIDISTIATTEEDASTLFNMIKTEAIGCTYLRDRMSQDTQDKFSFFTDADRKYGLPASLKVQCGSPKSGIIRSKNNLIIAMDEAAFLPVVGKANGREVYDAFSPSVSTFIPKGRENERSSGEGKIVLISSPYTKSGIFWEKYCESFQDPANILMFQFYSSLLNWKQDSDFLTAKKRTDRNKFMCEFGGQFSDTIAAWVDYNSLHACVTDERTTNRPKGERGISYFMGIDYGGKNDGSGVAICHKEDDIIVLDFAEVYYSKQSDVWDSKTDAYSEVSRLFGDEELISPSMFADEIKRLCSQFDVVEGWFDQFNGYGLDELFKERGLTQLEMKSVTNTINLGVYSCTKELINVGKVRLFNHPVLIRELETLEEHRDRNTAVIEAPQRSGFHDDISDAFARAVYSAYNSKKGKTQLRAMGMSGGRGLSLQSSGYRQFQFNRFKAHGGELYSNLFNR